MSEQSQRKRSPNFPYVSIRECVEYINKLHSQVAMSKVPVLIAFDKMGLTRKSSTTDRIRATLSSYKLTTEELVNKEKFLRLTELANKIVIETRENFRLQYLREAALNDFMMKKVWEKEWKRGLPNDDATIISVLRLEYGFQEEAAKRFAIVLKDNYRFCELAGHYETSQEENKGDQSSAPIKDNPNDETVSKPPIMQSKDLVQYPIPLDNNRFAYIYLPSSLTLSDSEFIPDFVNLLLKKLRKTNDNGQKTEE